MGVDSYELKAAQLVDRREQREGAFRSHARAPHPRIYLEVNFTLLFCESGDHLGFILRADRKLEIKLEKISDLVFMDWFLDDLAQPVFSKCDFIPVSITQKYQRDWLVKVPVCVDAHYTFVQLIYLIKKQTKN